MNYIALSALSILAIEHLPPAILGVLGCILVGIIALVCWWLFIPHSEPVRRPARKVAKRKPVRREHPQFRACAVGCMA